VNDEIAHKINWGNVLKGVRVLSKAANSLQTTSSDVEDLEQRINLGKIVRGGLGVMGGKFGDSQVVASDVQDVDPRFWGTLLKTGVRLLSGLAKDPEASSDVEDVQERINWLKIAKTAGKVLGGLLGDYSVLQDVLSDEGSYADAIASGEYHHACLSGVFVTGELMRVFCMQGKWPFPTRTHERL
jgi:hypothetical protein